jgi:hypothetical protein
LVFIAVSRSKGAGSRLDLAAFRKRLRSRLHAIETLLEHMDAGREFILPRPPSWQACLLAARRGSRCAPDANVAEIRPLSHLEHRQVERARYLALK